MDPPHTSGGEPPQSTVAGMPSRHSQGGGGTRRPGGVIPNVSVSQKRDLLGRVWSILAHKSILGKWRRAKLSGRPGSRWNRS